MTTPTQSSLEAMAAERMIVPVEMCDGVYAIDPDTAALVADRLVAEAVAQERARCLAIVADEVPDERMSSIHQHEHGKRSACEFIAARIESGETP